jgi:hypothetical protein
MSSDALFQQVDHEKKHKNPSECMTNCCYWPQYSPDGGVQWLLVKPWTLHWVMCTVMYRRIAMAIKTASKVGVCFSCHFICSCTWRLLEQYGASSCLMAASSGFWGSPRHAALGDAVCIVQRAHMAIKMARNGGALVFAAPFFACHNCS